MMAMPQRLYDLMKVNGKTYANAKCDLVPVVKYFEPGAAGVWLLTSIDPRDNNIMHGLIDLGIDLPILGPALWSELLQVRGRFETGLHRDPLFAPVHPISVYAHAAREAGRIIEDPQTLARSAVALGLDGAPHLPVPGKAPRH